MSDTVIRNVVIRTSIEADRTRQESGRALGPNGGAAGNAVSDLRRVREELRQNEDAHERHARTILKASLHGLHGFTTFSRGIALMTASNEEDVEKLAQKFMYLEGVVSTVKGGLKLTQFAAEFGSVGVAMGGLAAAAAAGIAIYSNYTAILSRMKDEVKALREEGERLRMEEDKRNSQMRQRHTAEEQQRIGNLPEAEQLAANQASIEGNQKNLRKQGKVEQQEHVMQGRAALEAAQTEGLIAKMPTGWVDYVSHWGGFHWSGRTYWEVMEERKQLQEKARWQRAEAVTHGENRINAQQEAIASTQALMEAKEREKAIKLKSFDSERQAAEKGLSPDNATFGGWLKGSDYIGNYGLPGDAGKRRKEVQQWLDDQASGKISSPYGRATDSEGQDTGVYRKQAMDKIQSEQDKFVHQMGETFSEMNKQLSAQKDALTRMQAEVTELRNAGQHEGK